MEPIANSWSLILTAPRPVPEAPAAIAEQCSTLGMQCARPHSLCPSSAESIWAVELILSPAADLGRSFLHGLTEALKAPRLGISLLPTEQRRLSKRLLAMDMDSTLIEQEGIDELARQAGVYEQVAELTRQAMQGEMDFNASLRRRCLCLAGASASIMKRARRRLTLTAGARQLMAALQARGCRTALLSGGFEELGGPLSRDLGFDHFFANRLEVRGGTLTGCLKGEIVNGVRKAEIVRRLTKRYGLKREEVVVLGDGANDLPMLQEAGLGIAFDAKPAVQQRVQHTINVRRLDAALCLMGLAV